MTHVNTYTSYSNQLISYDSKVESIGREALLEFKKSNKIVICAQGPSLVHSYIKSFSKDADVIGFGLTAFTNIKHSFLFWEPSFARLSSDWSTLNGYFNNINHFWYWFGQERLYSGLPSRLSELNNVCILANPRFYTEDFGPSMVLNDKSFCLPLFFIDESSDSNILQSLRRFFSGSHYLRAILNFRCSIVRAFSLCCFLGYTEVVFVGLDPSTHKYWFETSLEYLDLLLDNSTSSEKHFRSILPSFRELSGNMHSAHPGQNDYLGHFTYSNSLAITLALYKRYMSASFPKITFVGDDPIVLESLYYYFKSGEIIYNTDSLSIN